MQPPNPLGQLPVILPPTESDVLHSDAAAAVADVRRRYDVATSFLRGHFARVMGGAAPEGRYRAFYPQVSVSTACPSAMSPNPAPTAPRSRGRISSRAT